MINKRMRYVIQTKVALHKLFIEEDINNCKNTFYSKNIIITCT